MLNENRAIARGRNQSIKNRGNRKRPAGSVNPGFTNAAYQAPGRVAYPTRNPPPRTTLGGVMRTAGLR